MWSLVIILPLLILIGFSWAIWYYNQEVCPYCGSRRNKYIGSGGHCKSKYRCSNCQKEFTHSHAFYD